MKALRTRLAAAGLTTTPQQFYQYFINSLPVEYDMVIASRSTPSRGGTELLAELDGAECVA